jgi:hypothetical protein
MIDAVNRQVVFQGKCRKKYLSFPSHNYATLPPLKVLHKFFI